MTHQIINAFYLASRSRGYVVGATAAYPQPLTIRDINDVLSAHPVDIDRVTLDSCIFALDESYLNKSREDKGTDN